VKKILIATMTLLAFRANALEYALVAEGRSNTGDASVYTQNFTNGTATTFGGGILASFNLPLVFFRSGLMYVPRTYQVNTGNSVNLVYTMNSLDVPVMVGLGLGLFSFYAGADLGFKMSTSSSGYTATTFADNSTFTSPQVGIDLNLIKFRISAFYEAQTTVSTATSLGTTGAIRGTAIGARVGFIF